MAVKLNNIRSFHSEKFRTTVHLVKRSVGKYRTPGKKDGADLVWWRGQLARPWSVFIEIAPGQMELITHGKGKLMWFDAELFTETIVPTAFLRSIPIK